MRRIWIAFLLAPLVSSAALGALIAYPFMLLATAIVAVPLFLAFRRIGWLEWWHAVLGGTVGGICYVVADTYSTAGSNLDRLTSANNVLYVGVGALTGFVFWWMGVFRNPAFPFVASRFPRSVVMALPIAALVVLANRGLRESFHQGRVLAILEKPTPSRKGLAYARLSSGVTVQADVGDTWSEEMVLGKCAHFTRRWSAFRMRPIYEVTVPFGSEGGDHC